VWRGRRAVELATTTTLRPRAGVRERKAVTDAFAAHAIRTRIFRDLGHIPDGILTGATEAEAPIDSLFPEVRGLHIFVAARSAHSGGGRSLDP
jgi:hypothetical protein